MQGSCGASFAMTARLRVVAEYRVEIFICGRTNAAGMALTLRMCVRRGAATFSNPQRQLTREHPETKYGGH
jgi:hypothetical protein